MIIVAVGLLGWRAADDLDRPKLVLVQAEWSCRQMHSERDTRPVQNPDGSAGRVTTPIMVCDAWSRR